MYMKSCRRQIWPSKFSSSSIYVARLLPLFAYGLLLLLLLLLLGLVVFFLLVGMDIIVGGDEIIIVS